MKTLLLNGSDWCLRCYWPHQWKLKRSADQALVPALPIVPATVPGAVHEDLLRIGLIEDWRDGLNAAKCEWVNNREWSLSRSVTVPEDFDGRLWLECDGLDYSGVVRINENVLQRFECTHLRHRFDLSGHVVPGETFTLEFIFEPAPQIDGVFGYTSRIHTFKPRFGYYWDWCTRLVNVGIWQDARLVSRGSEKLESVHVSTSVSDDLLTGQANLLIHFHERPWGKVRCIISNPAGEVVHDTEQQIVNENLHVYAKLEEVQLWWPAGMGDQPLYHLTVELLDTAGNVSDRVERTIGFNRVRWLHNPGGPSGARPYTLEINGRRVFMRGVNWVPLSPLYGTVTPEQYEAFLRLYRNMNVNIIRVWGGGILEKPAFYEACDRLGLMVWQEFPLSSSGLDNWPPEDEHVIEELERIATEYIERRGHHACHVLWCGGNELQGGLDGGKVGVGRPVDESHPLMRRWQKLVTFFVHEKRFIPASPTGPRFYAYEGDFGKGIHHHTHGPWGIVPFDKRFRYFDEDDTLLRSETGAPGCSSMAALERHRGGEVLWPPRENNPHWLIPAANWIPWEDVEREFGPIADDPSQLAAVVKASRYLQAESYRYAAEATRRRWPTCSGLLIWMGHDSVPCTANNSVIQTDATVKPAYDWLQRAWAQRHVSLKLSSISFEPGSRLVGEVWLHRDDADQPASGTVTASLRRLDGETLTRATADVTGDGPSIRAVSLYWEVPAFDERLFVVDVIWTDGDREISNRYPLSQQTEHPLQPMWRLRPTELDCRRKGHGRVCIANTGHTAAVGVRLVSTGGALLTEANNMVLFPGESHEVGYEIIPTPWERGEAGADLRVEVFNSEADFTIS